MSERAQLKREIRRLPRGRGRCYPRELRERIETHCAARRREGATWSSLGEELSTTWETLRRWSTEHSFSSAALVPVEVVAEPASEAAVTVVSPTGWRFEGLEEGRFAALWRDGDDAETVRLTSTELSLFIEGCELVGRRALSPTEIGPRPLVAGDCRRRRGPLPRRRR